MDQDYTFRGIPHTHVEHFWPFAEPFIKRALDHAHGEMSHLDLKRMCINRDAQLWICKGPQKIVGAGTTEIVLYPQKKVCRMITLAGTEFDNWMEMAHDIIAAWARTQDCQSLQAYTRTGFVPKLRKLGYRNRYCVCDKSLE